MRPWDIAEGFDAEWRLVDLMTVEGELISRCEIFDEADLDAALARFENSDAGAAAGKRGKPSSRTLLSAVFAARDWDAMAEMLADDIIN